MNGLVEIGVLRMRRTADTETVGWGRYLREGFPLSAVNTEVSTATIAAAGRPWIYASAACAVLLLVDAAPLAASP